jgi:SAM-dependent methyltransferase
MGRWSRLIAAEFLPWLAVADGQDWLEVGCGTGALTNVILARNAPTSILAIDASDGFVDQARAAVTSDRATFRVGNAMALDVPPASRDVVVSGLVLNFVPDRAAELAGMAAVARPGLSECGCGVHGGVLAGCRGAESRRCGTARNGTVCRLHGDGAGGAGATVRAGPCAVTGDRGGHGIRRFRRSVGAFHAGNGACARLLRQS